jgi:ferredoxin-NADP reductase
LAALAVGARVEMHGPWGLFVLKPAAHHVLIAGGIGVTPFVSMIREAALSSADMQITLIYSNRTVDEAAYLDELQQIAAAHPNIRVIPTCTRESPSGWMGERGRIDAAMLHRAVPDHRDADYLMCGPDDFMVSMREILVASGVDSKRIKQESFG